jgi:hypothetical protein
VAPRRAGARRSNGGDGPRSGVDGWAVPGPRRTRGASARGRAFPYPGLTTRGYLVDLASNHMLV